MGGSGERLKYGGGRSKLLNVSFVGPNSRPSMVGPRLLFASDDGGGVANLVSKKPLRLAWLTLSRGSRAGSSKARHLMSGSRHNAQGTRECTWLAGLTLHGQLSMGLGLCEMWLRSPTAPSRHTLVDRNQLGSNKKLRKWKGIRVRHPFIRSRHRPRTKKLESNTNLQKMKMVSKHTCHISSLIVGYHSPTSS